MNIKLLRKIKAEIRKEPLHFNMTTWITTSDSVAPCGTAGCIAGFACALELKGKAKRNWVKLGESVSAAEHSFTPSAVLFQSNTAEEAKGLLGLDSRESKRLFIPDSWPGKFRDPFRDLTDQLEDVEWDNNVSAKRKARRLRRQLSELAIRRINHFIKTEGAE